MPDVEVSRREAVALALGSRLDRWSGGDLGAVTGGEVDEELHALLTASADLRTDLAARRIAGRVFWARALQAPERDAFDVAMAAHLLAPVWADDEGAVPAALVERFAADGLRAGDIVPSGPDEWARTAAAMLEAFRAGGVQDDLILAIAFGYLGVLAIPDGHPGLRDRMAGYADALFELAVTADDLPALDAAFWAQTQALDRTTEDEPEWPSMMGRLGEIRHLRAELTGAGEPVASVGQVEPVGPGETAAHALQAGDADRAVRLLEHGRGLLPNEALDARTDVTDLRAGAADGPIVMVSVGPFRSDALAIGRDGVQVIPLAGIDLDAAGALTERFQEALGVLRAPGSTREETAEARETVRWVLARLWDAVTGPVLDGLGFRDTPDEEQVWPRVWWSPGSALAALPLHAAGHEPDAAEAGADGAGAGADGAGAGADGAGAAPRRSALDRVVSSYTPTVRALLDARARAAAAPADRPEPLVVAVPDATREAVAAELPERACVRFAPAAGHPLRLAGYAYAVGTLWEVDDAVAVQAARGVRERLRAFPRALDDARAAEALHRAVRGLRRAYPGSPALWAGFVHVGA